jgi:hypothetical protein
VNIIVTLGNKNICHFKVYELRYDGIPKDNTHVRESIVEEKYLTKIEIKIVTLVKYFGTKET